MNVLLSIKPKYVEEIKKQTKKYEFRKSTFRKLGNSEKVYIYSSSPVKKIVGSFKIGEIVEGSPKVLWQQFKDVAGINKDDFFKYFKNKETGFAINIENLEIFEEPIDPFELGEFTAPQSYYYLKRELFEKILECKSKYNEDIEDIYESGHSIRMFEIIENDLVTFFRYIPPEYYDNEDREKIISPVLVDLLIRIGSQIDIFFRNWDLVHELNPEKEIGKLNIGNYKALEKKLYLEDQKVFFLPTSEIKTPFKNWTKWDKEKNWWNAYNLVKHNGYKFREQGNLQNVIEALAALFLLNCLHEKVKFKVLKQNHEEITPNNYGQRPKQKTKLFQYIGTPGNVKGLIKWQGEINI